MTTAKSSITPVAPSTIPATTPLADSANMMEPMGVMPNADTVVPDTTSVNSLMFPLLLVFLAVFPFAFGVGTSRLKASTSRAQALAASHHQRRPHDNHATHQIRGDRRVGDQHFLQRRYEVAMQYYQPDGIANVSQTPPELLYRIGLCQEGLGQWDKALETLQTVSESTDRPILQAAAEFGRSRIWLRKNDPIKAATILRSIALHVDTDRPLPRNLSQEIEFLLPLTLARETVLPREESDPAVAAPMNELFVWSLEAALAWVPDLQPDFENEVALDATTPGNIAACRRRSEQSGESTSADGMTVQIDCIRQPVRALLERLSAACGWNTDLSPLVSDGGLDQVVSVVGQDLPANWVFTALCSEFRWAWTLHENQLTFHRASDSDHGDEATRQMIGQTLNALLSQNPNSRFATHCRFALAQLAEFDGDLSKSAELYSSIVGRDSSSIAVHAAYRAGCNYLKLGELTRASVQFSYVVHGAPGHKLHVKSLVQYGRLLLDMGEIQEAVFQFRRAAEAENRPDDQALAAAYLGMGLLMQHKYHEAAEAILAHRFQFQDPVIHNAAAFVTSVARWKSCSKESQDREAAFLYRATVAVKSEPDWFGQTGQLLIGRVYSELGFDDLMVELYSRMLSAGVTEWIGAEMMLSLAEYEQSNGNPETAKSYWLKMAAGKVTSLANRARLRLAEVSLEAGQPAECLEFCAAIQSDPPITRMDILKLMGKAYEQMGDDIRAARCYAGQLPTSEKVSKAPAADAADKPKP